MTKPKLAYLASEYPGISHTFIFREIYGLRSLGFQVSTASIRRPANLSIMTGLEKQDAEETLYIKDTARLRAGLAHVGLFLRSPRRYFQMLGKALAYYRRGPRNILKVLAYIAEAGVLLQWLRRQGIGHVHVHFGNPAATVAMIASEYGTMSYSLSIHGPDIFYDVTINLLPDKVKKAVFVRCISYFCQSQLMRLVPYEYWDRFNIVRCGVNLEVFGSRPIPDNPVPHILCVGRLVPSKGQHILVESCGRLKDRGIPFHLTFVGPGDDLNSLQALSQKLNIVDQVTFTGAVGQGEVHQYYDRADVFVLPSFAEGVPVVLMEAMAKEITCISTHITGIPELITHNVDGLLVTPGNVDELTNALVKVLSAPERRQQMGQQARHKIADKYNLPVNCQAMGTLFHQYLSSKGL
jgi:colanic acid/amylovoran biosynthesis glycosyltransferase